ISGIAAPRARSRPARRMARASLPGRKSGFGLPVSGFGFAPPAAEIVFTAGVPHRNNRISKYPPMDASRIPPSGRSRIAPPMASPQPNQSPVARVHVSSDEDEKGSATRLGPAV